MKILVVDDNADFIDNMWEGLQTSGLRVAYIIPGLNKMQVWGSSEFVSFKEDNNTLHIVKEADVIFLDHNMPNMKGDELVDFWKNHGVEIAGKRIVGISSDAQPYLKEQVNPRMLYFPESVKRFLGL